MVEKLYYSIGEVARMFNVNTSLIRFWEKEFDVLDLKKNKKGNRLFTKQDIERFREIYHLVKEEGFTLEGAKSRLKGRNHSDLNNRHEVIERLQRIRKSLIELKSR